MLEGWAGRGNHPVQNIPPGNEGASMQEGEGLQMDMITLYKV